MEYTVNMEIGNYRIVDIFKDSENNTVLTLKCLKCNTVAKFYSKADEFDPYVKCPTCKGGNPDIIVGTKIDSLLILGKSLQQTTDGRSIYLCLCDCGRLIFRSRRYLSKKTIKHSCGCYINQYPQDLSGLVFGKLKVIRYTGFKNKDNKKIYLCHCECGNEKEVSEKLLKNGNTTSCGKCNHESLIGKRFGRLLVLERLPRVTTNGLTKYRLIYKVVMLGVVDV